jgi:hypothetical protein
LATAAQRQQQSQNVISAGGSGVSSGSNSGHRNATNAGSEA